MPHYSLGLGLILAAAVLAWLQRGWYVAIDLAALDPSERDFLGLQYERRLYISLLMATAGVAIVCGAWVVSPVWLAVYWLAVIGLVLWVMLLAVYDFAVARRHYSQLLDDLDRMQNELHKELARESRRLLTDPAARSPDDAPHDTPLQGPSERNGHAE